MVFALDSESNSAMQAAFRDRQVCKKYLALVRGFTPPNDTINYDLRTDGKLQSAVTSYRTLQHFEVPVPLGKHDTSRYSLVEVSPETGRFHQIRKHFGHISHPVIGDIEHGCNKQNNMFRKKWASSTMYLHACEISFRHPSSGQEMHLIAEYRPEFQRMLDVLNELNMVSDSGTIIDITPPSATT